jgi:hypothetical protein
MMGPTKSLGGVGKEMGRIDVENEVLEAYEVVKRIDKCFCRYVLLASRCSAFQAELGCRGTEIWVAAENAYNERVTRVETQIIARSRD